MKYTVTPDNYGLILTSPEPIPKFILFIAPTQLKGQVVVGVYDSAMIIKHRTCSIIKTDVLYTDIFKEGI